MAVIFHLVLTGAHTWTKSQKLVGMRDISLSPEGRNQARAAAKYLQQIPLQAIYYARTTRAAQTFKIIYEQLFPQAHRSIQQDLRVHIRKAILEQQGKRGAYFSLHKRNNLSHIPAKRDSRLNDIDFGLLQGLFPEECEARYPQQWHALHHDPTTLQFPQGESITGVVARTQSFIQEQLRHELFDAHYAIITHSYIARIFMLLSQNSPISELSTELYSDGQIIVVKFG